MTFMFLLHLVSSFAAACFLSLLYDVMSLFGMLRLGSQISDVDPDIPVKSPTFQVFLNSPMVTQISHIFCEHY